MQIWIEEIASTLPFQVTLAETRESDWAARHSFATEAQAKAYAVGLCDGLNACAASLPAAPKAIEGFNRREKRG